MVRWLDGPLAVIQGVEPLPAVSIPNLCDLGTVAGSFPKDLSADEVVDYP